MATAFCAAGVLSTPWVLVDLVVLYIAGSLLGVPLEGFYTLITQGHWETHVVSMFCPLCVIYGFGAVLYYIASALCYNKPFVVRFLLFAAVGTFFELLCGLLLMYGLKMKAWDYSSAFLNYKGLICLDMFFIWGLLGVGFCLLLPKCSALLSKLHKSPFGLLSGIAAVLLIADLAFAGICIVRWKDRRDQLPPETELEKLIDKNYPDDFMQHRFIEWRILQNSDLELPPETVNAI